MHKKHFWFDIFNWHSWCMSGPDENHNASIFFRCCLSKTFKFLHAGNLHWDVDFDNREHSTVSREVWKAGLVVFSISELDF